ncbi:TlyA family RNA methyltransferase [Bacillus horti]|uniref:23S rRNA (Cytidine1920-2'-O)/16S rRNA (Cytidine1409-2'-O)-methyltransferase n=1 Tax=Caldalkalibacillus horti TaxID=77523 RepID=A0ABT9W0U5_9BACI|nr:TlyA family RNA methyltransferase [Bacillus horti]MDQ0166869.1 23S rRNA (cytidine1920-2'-O)/16S rRNA (cytidine1409-2'-O)-methyltransferase [Bacillus horti]
MAAKERIDVLLVQHGFFDTREKAKRAVMAGLVFSKTERLDKPGTKVPLDTAFEVKGSTLKYVSRGGLKLEKAIESFDLDLKDKTVIDIGASTGGFTDCALQNGAKLVYALDVGYNQLDWKLRSHEQVVVMERTNFRYVEAQDLKHGLPKFATIDVSFISLRLILPVLYQLLCQSGEVVALIKPQFEAGKDQVGKKGVVREARIHREVLTRVLSFAQGVGFALKNLDYSPITGGEGNIEFLVHLQKEAAKPEQELEKLDLEIDPLWMSRISDIVQAAHNQLAKS